MNSGERRTCVSFKCCQRKVSPVARRCMNVCTRKDNEKVMHGINEKRYNMLYYLSCVIAFGLQPRPPSAHAIFQGSVMVLEVLEVYSAKSNPATQSNIPSFSRPRPSCLGRRAFDLPCDVVNVNRVRAEAIFHPNMWPDCSSQGFQYGARATGELS
jgi:hypothetical protein